MTTHKIQDEDFRAILARKIDWARFDGKTVLISGANGFLPAYMVETLLFRNETVPGAGTTVIGLVRNQARAESRFARHLARPDFRLLVQDVCAPLEPGEKVDFVIHAASLASPKFFGTNPVDVIDANTLGTRNLLDLAHRNDAEGFLFFSSGEVYGNLAAHQIPTKETEFGPLDLTEVRSCYGESKRLGENMCVSWHHQHGVRAKIVRPFHVYGPGMDLTDGRVFADFVADALAGRDIRLNSDGLAVRAFCYLADATAANFLILLNGKNGEAYNVGDDNGEISILELAKLVAEIAPRKGTSFVHNYEKPPEGYLKSKISRACPNISKIIDLGWTPEYLIKEGFARTINSYSAT